MEMRGIDPRTSRMLSERSTIWATSPCYQNSLLTFKIQIFVCEASETILAVLVSTLKWRSKYRSPYLPHAICLLYLGLKWLDTSKTSNKGSWWWCLNSTTYVYLRYYSSFTQFQPTEIQKKKKLIGLRPPNSLARRGGQKKPNRTESNRTETDSNRTKVYFKPFGWKFL